MSVREIVFVELDEDGLVLNRSQLAGIFRRLDDLVEQLGPKDANGILQLSYRQRHAVVYFKEWLEDNYGPIE